MAASAPTWKTISRRFTAVVTIANSVGGLVTFFFFNSIYPLPTGTASLYRTHPLSAAIFGGVLVISFLVGNFWNNKQEAAIREWYGRLQGGGDAAAVPAAVRRNVLNWCPRVALVSMAMWLLIGTAFALLQLSARGFALALFGGIVGIGGVLTSAVVYFACDLVWRPTYAVFFPDGRLSAVRAWRLPVLGRLLIVSVLVAVWPLTIVVVLALQRAGAIIAAANPGTLLDNMRILMAFLLGVGILSSITMAVFMARGITEPLHTLQEAMGRVEQNDLAVQVPVTSNDELGYLAERFNQMTAGLRQGKLMRNLLNLYVTPEVARQAIERGVHMGGDLVECTVLFSDIRGFTGLAERLAPAALIETLNRYMTAMVAVVVAEGGMVNKFGGDSLLAVFGTPLNPAPDHATRAVRAARGMLAALAVFNQEQERRAEPTLRIGIGIATGPAVAGNVGGKERIEYTVIGDTVNLAARLQDKTKELGGPILLSAETQSTAAPAVVGAAERLAGVEVRGKAEPVEVYVVR